MSKAIIICCDGAWNRLESGQAGDRQTSSNILRCVAGLRAHSGSRDQVIFHDEGVGGEGFNRWPGGIFSLGLSGVVLRAYRFIAYNWSPGDEIYLLGFSRGAYTVRSLAGFIHEVGLIDKADLYQLPLAYQWYRANPGEERNSLDQAPMVEELRQSGRRIPIAFLGVFETIGCCGIPMPGLRAFSQPWVGFHNTQLSETVSYAVQALGIDEQRASLRPDLWTYPDETDTDHVRLSNRQALQVWLPGDHADMGGRSPRSCLSDAALQFMIAQTSQHGLAWQSEWLAENRLNYEQAAPGIKAQGLFGRAFGAYNRPIGTGQRQNAELQTAINEKIHSATIERLENGGSFSNRANLEAALEAGTPVFYERQYERQAVPEALAVADIPGEGQACTLLDLSLTGARILSSSDWKKGQALRIRHPRIGDREATIKWSEGREAGVEFAA